MAYVEHAYCYSGELSNEIISRSSAPTDIVKLRDYINVRVFQRLGHGLIYFSSAITLTVQWWGRGGSACRDNTWGGKREEHVVKTKNMSSNWPRKRRLIPQVWTTAPRTIQAMESTQSSKERHFFFALFCYILILYFEEWWKKNFW